MSTGLNPRLMVQHVEAGHKVQQHLNTFFLALIKGASRQLLVKPSASQFPDGNYLNPAMINFLPLAITLPNKQGKSCLFVWAVAHEHLDTTHARITALCTQHAQYFPCDIH
jgi:hypothetical protein